MFQLYALARHSERSRFSGGAKDLPYPVMRVREIPRPTGENAGLRDDRPLGFDNFSL
jgi:hypothetical protein